MLEQAARRLQGSVRAGDTVSRISGDEFAVILSDLARPEDAGVVAQKIIERLGAPYQLRGKETFVTASVGIAAYPADGASAEALLAADAAMYRAKQSGRGGYQFFTAEINQRTRARAQLGAELRRALEREEFFLVYQPKYDLASGQICGAEALLRWSHPQRGVVSPAEFVPVLEESGLIVPVGKWVLRRTIIEMARTLNFTVIAEGVENEAQVAFLRQFGCEQAQGFLFARPMPADALRSLILVSKRQ